MFQAIALVWQTAQNGRLHKTGEPTLRAAQCLTGISNAFSASFTSIWPSFPQFYCTPQKSVPTLRYTYRHILSAVLWISEDRLFRNCVEEEVDLGSCSYGFCGPKTTLKD